MGSGILDEIADKLCLRGIGKPLLAGMAAILAMVAIAIWLVLPGVATTNDFVIDRGDERADQSMSNESRAPIFVHVSGAVVNPGLYELEKGSRVADAVSAAGGFTEDAIPDSCNLAKALSDGEKLVIASTAASGQADNPSQQGNPDAQANATSLVNLNTATASELESLPGIGESTARRIIADRQAHGPFESIDDLMRVSGIGQKKLDALAGLVCV